MSVKTQGKGFGMSIGIPVILCASGISPDYSLETSDENSQHELTRMNSVDSLGDALKLRRQWMRQMGIPEDEIAECCNPDQYDIDLAEEMENLKAMQAIKTHNAVRK